MLGYAAGLSFQALRLYQYYFGPLPFKTISVTEQPVMGYGQSWPTLIFLPYDSLLDSTTRHFFGFQVSAEEAEFYNVVAIHEMAHQWWGHLVGWKTYRDQWMSEGFAEFSASLYVRKAQTEKIRTFWDLKRKWLLSKGSGSHRPVDVGPLYLNEQLNAHLEPQNAMFNIYYKGAYVLEMIRLFMEDRTQREPDQRFIDMMHDFVSTYANRNASTADFQRMVEKHMGQAMDWFFNEYVYGTEIPTYDFQYTLKPTGDGKSLLQCSLTQSGVSDQFQMRVPVYVTMGKRTQRLGLISIKGSTTVPNQVVLPYVPDRISIDEYHDVLAIEHQ
jgi:aminopeptidase N